MRTLTWRSLTTPQIAELCYLKDRGIAQFSNGSKLRMLGRLKELELVTQNDRGYWRLTPGGHWTVAEFRKDKKK